MTRLRVAAAAAALLTALLVQATLVGPLTLSLPVSVPALLVAATALVDGPGAGLAFGFTAGLVADLGSEHPAGVLALCWLGVGLACGLCAAPRGSLLRDAAVATAVCGIAGAVAAAVLAVAASVPATADGVARSAILALPVQALLALPVVAAVRLFLRSDALKAPRPVLVLGADR